ncbi:GntR family transcriptional regulator [Dactylosporangium aurantiacum]|uniref:GntR family transcriptional regulator n=1 Tax=Dactylosporangium aurantiacum TaxID=35754 RepID=A0A9Q9MJV0_9ACTN|nr:GntR family transcriptional regulator [Dactylosporangium aurantiacum]MDG6101971.1 GntR family transcriptional regulator [Dactylosporangium aurantiacum]UWZ52242.1 GntR family transcriptional regulator [Dactylosporangium aurantiacum]
MTINPGAAEFPHRQIAAQLRARIHRGDWAPGERLPSIPTLATQFGVAKQTVQRTIDQLRIEGLLITRPGSGTFVRGTKRRMNRLSRGRYGAERGYHAELAARYRQHLMQVGVMPCPADVAEGFGIDPGVPLLVRRHLVRTGDAPVEVGASWFRPADVRGTSIERPDVFDRPLYQEVEAELGRRYTSAKDQVSARLPTREEAELLQIRPDTPVLVLLHIAYDAEHRPIEVAQAAWPGPMTTLTEEYKIPGVRPGVPHDEPDLALG